MLKLVQSLFAPKPNPVGIDFGSETLRMAQVQHVNGEFKLTAASSVAVPASARKEPAARRQFLADACRTTFAKGGFAGRQVVLGMPAQYVHMIHLRLPMMDEDSLKRALPWEVKGKLPIDPSQAELRHFIAGEIFQDQESKLEVIVLAVQRDMRNEIIKIAEEARLQVVGLAPEPKALLDCFRLISRKKGENDPTTMFIDIGFSGTRVLVADGDQVTFARFVAIGGDQFNYAASVALKVPVHEARNRRIELASIVESDSRGDSAANANDDATAAKRMAERGVIEEACREPFERLMTELELCRRYHEATFPNRPIDRVVFVGGEAMQRSLCQKIAKGLGIAAQLGDPMVRLGRTSSVPPENGLDVNRPQPAWAIAVGLSIGQSAG